MSLKIRWTNKFKKDYTRCINRGFDIRLLNDVIKMLSGSQSLPQEYKDHKLTGEWEGFRECHIKPDWLLIYAIKNDLLILTLSRTGTHSDLFG